MNLVGSYNRTGAWYTNIYHNYTTDILYVTDTSNGIDLFYRNLTYISYISFSNKAYALTETNDKLYVGLYGGTISVLNNNLVVKNFPVLCTEWISFILIDTNYLMSVLCYSNLGMLYLYTTNGSYTGKSMTTPTYPRFMSYDLNGHFIIAGYNQIYIYY